VTTYVAMLRGVNVSGRNALPMDDLRALVAEAGGTDVQTYIQSGNAVFRSRRSPSVLIRSLESGLESVLGATVPVLLRTKEELDGVIKANPFVRRGEDVGSLHVTFLGAAPEPATAAAVVQPRGDDDEFQVVGREVYLFCPHGYGNTKLTNTFFEKKLGSRSTTRNWRTVTTLVSMAQG
jgi:uncharacterized protein (DUF1697 family)